MKSGEAIEDHSTLLLTIDVNMSNWTSQKLEFYKKFVANVSVGNMIIVRGTIFDDCFPIPVELLPTNNPAEYTEIEQVSIFSNFKIDVSPTPMTDRRLNINKTDDIPSYAGTVQRFDANSIELIQKKLFSKGFMLLRSLQDAFGSVKIKLKHESGHEIQLLPNELIITVKKVADHTIYCPKTGQKINPQEKKNKRLKRKAEDRNERPKQKENAST